MSDVTDLTIHEVKLRWQVEWCSKRGWRSQRSSVFKFKNNEWNLRYYYDRSHVLFLEKNGIPSSSSFVVWAQLEDGGTGQIVPGLSEKKHFARFYKESEVIWRKSQGDVEQSQVIRNPNNFKLRFLVVLEGANEITDTHYRPECSIPEVTEQSTDAGSVQTTLRRKPTPCQERLLRHVADFMSKSDDSGVCPPHIATMWDAVKHLVVPEEGAGAGSGIGGQGVGAGSGQDTEGAGFGAGAGAGSGSGAGGASGMGSGVGAGEDSGTIQTGCSIPEVAGQSSDAGSVENPLAPEAIPCLGQGKDYDIVRIRSLLANMSLGSGTAPGALGGYGQGAGSGARTGSGQGIGGAGSGAGAGAGSGSGADERAGDASDRESGAGAGADSRTIPTGWPRGIPGQSTDAGSVRAPLTEPCLGRLAEEYANGMWGDRDYYYGDDDFYYDDDDPFEDNFLGSGAAAGSETGPGGLGGHGRGLGAGSGTRTGYGQGIGGAGSGSGARALEAGGRGSGASARAGAGYGSGGRAIGGLLGSGANAHTGVGYGSGGRAVRGPWGGARAGAGAGSGIGLGGLGGYGAGLEIGSGLFNGTGVGLGGYGQGLGGASTARSVPVYPGMGPGGLFGHGQGLGTGSSARSVPVYPGMGLGGLFGHGQGLGAGSSARSVPVYPGMRPGGLFGHGQGLEAGSSTRSVPLYPGMGPDGFFGHGQGIRSWLLDHGICECWTTNST